MCSDLERDFALHLSPNHCYKLVDCEEVEEPHGAAAAAAAAAVVLSICIHGILLGHIVHFHISAAAAPDTLRFRPPPPGTERYVTITNPHNKVWSGTPVRDISCYCHPLTGAPVLASRITQSRKSWPHRGSPRQESPRGLVEVRRPQCVPPAAHSTRAERREDEQAQMSRASERAQPAEPHALAASSPCDMS